MDDNWIKRIPVAWTVHKFGGTSLADAACFRRVADIVVGRPEGNLAVVVSAIGGVTDLLLSLIDQASRGESVESSIETLQRGLRVDRS